MRFLFDDFELDTDKAELRGAGETIALEPQVFALLRYLVENRERLVTKNQLIDTVWGGRVVSESALTSRIKSARQALGDTGREQRFIRTIHGSGYRFVVDVEEAAPGSPVGETSSRPDVAAPEDPLPERPSIAVLPFRLVGIAGPYAAVADALPHELIAELSRLRWLFVIARASSFRFRASEPDVVEIGRVLGVRYCLSGTAEILGDHLRVTVELADTRSGGVLWGERYGAPVEQIDEIRSEIVASVVSALEIQIPSNEARLARLSSTENLDAWAAYHLGLHHMFRFSRKDNERAKELFARAIGEDAGFARAHAGMSFVRFQDAFLAYEKDVEAAGADARRFAERSVELDAMDPFANLVLGRTFWLAGDPDASLPWLDRAMSLSPSYAQGVYARGFSNAMAARGDAAEGDADLAMSLSPLDPLYYAMLGIRAFSHVVRGEYDAAVAWGERAARAPGAHAFIDVLAGLTHACAGDTEKARAWITRALERSPKIDQTAFFRSFPFTDAVIRKRIAAALTKSGL